MRRQFKIFALLLLVFQMLAGLPGWGQYRFDQMVQISDNKEVNFRTSIKEGKNGFIWIATNNGLCRFDGQRFFFFKHDPENPHSIFSNEVLTVLPIGNKIWVGTLQGLSILDIYTNQFRNYQLDEGGKVTTLANEPRKEVSSLFVDRQGDIWVGTRFLGLWKYDPLKDDFVRFNLDHEPTFIISAFEHHAINTIEQSLTNDSIIWAGTAAGLMEINKYSQEVSFYTFPRKDKSYQSVLNIIRQVYHHNDSLVYVCTWAGGVHVFDTKKKTLSLLSPENDPENLLSKSPVGRIVPKSAHELWFTAGYGLFLYSTRENRILYKIKADPIKEKYYGIYLIDRDKRTWFSSFKGLFLYNPSLQQFKTYSIEPLLNTGSAQVGMIFLQEYDQQNDRIVACPRTTNGLYFFDRQRETWTVAEFENVKQFGKDGSHLDIYGFKYLGQDEYILAGMQGLFKFRLGENRLRPIITTDQLQGSWFTALCMDHEGKLWLGTTNAGLFRMDANTAHYEVFQEAFSENDKIPARIDLLYEDSRGNIWIKRTEGLSVYIREEDRIQNFLYTANPDNSFSVVDAFAEDKYGRIWTCSEEGRMGFMEAAHPEKGIIRKLNIQQDAGLEGQILGLTSSPEGDIWGCTTKDIFRIEREEKVAAHFSLKYSSLPINFFGMKTLPDGQLVIGGRKEITLTYPQQLQRNDEVPMPYLTQISIRQKPLTKGFPLFGKQPLELRHNENFFSVAFAAQAYTFSQEVQFRYRLEGLEDWIDAGDGLVANYTNVPSGDYTFQLMAANNENIWNEQILEIPVIIRPAWYKNWWFLTLTGLLFFYLIYTAFSYRIKQVRKEEKIKADYERKLAGVEMSALVAQMNPHFLFNSLNSIDSYIIKNQSIKASEYLNSFARLMRLILQNSRSNYISLQSEIEGLELYLQMECMRSEGLFEYTICIDPEVDIHQIEIPPMLIQPYIENAIWHGVRHLENGKIGQIALFIAMHLGKLKIIVQDNGIGRIQSAEIQKRKSNGHKRSMGMQITKSRIEMINKLYNADASVIITDLYDDGREVVGTKVTLTIAI